MITQSNIDNLYKITSNLAMQDYLRMNPRDRNGKPKYKEHRQYSLSTETLEAQELYAIATKCEQDITQAEKEKIKAYLLKIKLVRPELLAI